MTCSCGPRWPAPNLEAERTFRPPACNGILAASRCRTEGQGKRPKRLPLLPCSRMFQTSGADYGWREGVRRWRCLAAVLFHSFPTSDVYRVGWKQTVPRLAAGLAIGPHAGVVDVYRVHI